MNALSTRPRPAAWLGIGAVLTLFATILAVDAWRVDADPGDHDTTFVPVTPCRLFDTRDAGDVPFGPDVWRSFEAHGTHGDCAIPTTAVGLSLNVTAVDPTLPTFLTVYPDDATRPLASSLNPTPGEPPTPNAVMTDLSPGGRFRIYNLQGVVDVIVDVNGYFVANSLRELHQRLAALETRDPEVRLAHAVSTNVDEAVFGGGTSANILTTVIHAPAPGTLVISAMVDVGSPSANSLACDLIVDGAFVAGSVMFESIGAPQNGEGTCASTVTKPVGVGPHTVSFEVYNYNSEALDDAALWVLWVRS